jgi:hypothetical protein
VIIQAAIWAWELKPSLFRMLRTWLSTVRSEMNSRVPICLLVRPSGRLGVAGAGHLDGCLPGADAAGAVGGRAARPLELVAFCLWLAGA